MVFAGTAAGPVAWTDLLIKVDGDTKCGSVTYGVVTGICC